MDWNEVKKGFKYRHPWELSRTRKVSGVFKKITYSEKLQYKFIDIGAGDAYFDDKWKRLFPGSVCYAVDIGYGEDCYKENKEESSIKKFYSIEQISDRNFDFILMLDSLQYFEDEVKYISHISEYLKQGGMILFTVTAFAKLYTVHDKNVGALRRYNYKDMIDIIDKVEGLELIYDQYFYFSLLLIRAIQKIFKLKIDPKNVQTTAWKYSERNIATKIVVGVLNFDFSIQTIFRKIGIKIPGLSILMICKKV